MPRSIRRRGPGRPREESRQLAQLHTIGDRVAAQAVHGRRLREEPAVVRDEAAEGVGLRGRQRQRLRRLVVAVGAQVRDRLAPGRIRRGSAMRAPDEIRGAAQVVGGEVGPEVRAVTKRGAVLHQPVVQEDLLALLDVPAGVEDPALRIDDSLRNRRVRHVRAVGQQPEDEEPAHDHQQRRLDPHSGNQQTPAFFGHALPP